MKWLLLSTLLTGSFTWGSGLVASAAETDEPAVKTQVIKHDGGHMLFITADAEGVGDGHAGTATIRIGADGEPDCDGNVRVIRRGIGGQPHMLRFAAEGVGAPISLISTGENADGGWLGVQLSSARDGDDVTEGIVVSNIAKGSAADAAGFERGDVIVEVDDRTIGDDLGVLVNQVRDAGAGDRMKFTVKRDGGTRILVATLGRRGDVKNIEWQFETDASTVLRDELRASAKVLLKSDDGEWRFETLGDGVDLDSLPSDISRMLPRFHSRSMNVVVGDDDDERHVAIVINRDGENLNIESTDHGGIKVTRTDAETEEETVTVYADEDELEAGDADAFEIFSHSGGHFVIDLDDEADTGKVFSFRFGDKDGPHAVWLQNIEEELADESDALSAALERLKNIEIDIDVPNIAVPHVEHAEGGNTFFEYIRGNARQTIRQNPDGTIDVITRKGGNELVKRYADEADLQDRNAAAYATFLDLQDDD